MKLNLHISRLRAFARNRGESRVVQFGRDAQSDWKIIIVSFFALTVILVVISVFVYRRVDVGDIFLVDRKEPMTSDTLNRFELEKTVAFFEAKLQRFEKLRDNPLSLQDPGGKRAKKN